MLVADLQECVESEKKNAAISKNVNYTCDFEGLSCCSGTKMEQSLLQGTENLGHIPNCQQTQP